MAARKNGTVPTNGPVQALVQPTVHFGCVESSGNHNNSEYEEQLLQIADARRQQRLRLETKVRKAQEAASSRVEQEASEKKNADIIKTISAQKQRQRERAKRIAALENTRH